MFPTYLNAPEGTQFNQYSDERNPLGTRLVLHDGREFLFVKNGASAMAAGKLYQAPAATANHQNLTVAAAASVGDRTITVTLGATAVTKDQYKDGYILIFDGAGAGYAYRIGSHAAVDSAGTFEVPLQAGHAVKEAIAAAATIATLQPNIHSGLVIHPSPPTAAVIGVAVTDLPASYYGWVQVKGPAAVLTDGTVAIGSTVVPSASVDGAVATFALTEGTPNTGGAQFEVGSVIRVQADTKYSLVNLRIG